MRFLLLCLETFFLLFQHTLPFLVLVLTNPAVVGVGICLINKLILVHNLTYFLPICCLVSLLPFLSNGSRVSGRKTIPGPIAYCMVLGSDPFYEFWGSGQWSHPCMPQPYTARRFPWRFWCCFCMLLFLSYLLCFLTYLIFIIIFVYFISLWWWLTFGN